ncbi:TetR/AcrR family transcriptional regulator [Actinomadura harenae]|uniref:TetR/AcrR family transcriptional regulator n=1 Tax=Actinomadura harenae TaxID=2483351 RepID=A0A3M2LWR6_9ACTN|nr:TetR/AcrR family transcriptional regulator [Actinomadura harenae]RMI41871.1 TetR/AcrR family transcriptional regulator [Actinomadura harenae]
MGERDKLIDGARRCLEERGYAHTTARDIARASGANLASIGYHFGSKDGLLVEAMVEATTDWADKLRQALADDAPHEEFETLWRRAIELVDLHRPIFVANVEVVAQAERRPRLRQALADAQETARLELSDWPGETGLPQTTRRAVGAFYLTLLTGLIMQRLIDPDRAPTAETLTEALRAIQTRTTPPGGDVEIPPAPLPSSD